MSTLLFTDNQRWISFLCLGYLLFFWSPLNLNAQKDYKQVIIKIESLAEENLYDSAAVLIQTELRPILKSFEDWEITREKLVPMLSKWEKNGSASSISTLRHFIALSHFENGTFEEAINWWSKSLFFWQNQDQPDTLKMANIYQRLGEVRYRQGNFDQALNYYQTGIKLLEEADLTDTEFASDLHYFSGVIYAEKGSYAKALEKAQKGHRILKSLFEDTHYYNAMYLLFYGNIANFQANYTEALDWYEKALQIVLNSPEKFHKELGYYYGNVGIAYAYLKDFETAELYTKKSIEQYTKRWGESHPMVAFGRNDLGEAAFNQNKLEEALQHLLPALNTIKNTLGESNAYIPKIYNNIGKTWLKKENYEEALHYFQQALCANTGQRYAANEINELPNFDDYFNPVYLLHSIKGKGQTLLEIYKKTNEQNLLAQAQSLYYSADLLIDQIRQTHLEPADKISFGETAKAIYEAAIESCWLNYHLSENRVWAEKAFLYAEKNKAIVLLQTVTTNQALQFSGIPDSLQAQETKLKKELLQFEKQRFTAKRNKDTDQISKIEIDYEQAKKRYQQLVTKLEKRYPQYYQLKYDLGLVSSTKVQAYLKDKATVLVDYFVGESSFYTFVLSPDTVYFYAAPVEILKQKINQFRTQFFSYDQLNSHDATDFGRAAIELYNLLLQPVFASLQPDEIQRLLIIPDDVLNYLPFETLLEKLPTSNNLTFANLPYLIRQYSFSYAWSAALLLRQQVPDFEAQYNYVGFAPTYDNATRIQLDSLELVAVNFQTRSGWQDLPAARNSVQTIAKQLGGEAFLAKEATKDNFFKTASKSKILHFAMHASLDDKNPFYSGLMFHGAAPTDNLYAYELYNTALQTELAVLSACNTGLGELKKGEGMMSLSRAFSWAGCPSIVMSQWSVPDAASAKIMTDFHQNLLQGKTKDQALRQSKLAYLHNGEIAPDRMHPFFWAGFVPLGNMESMDLKSSNSWILFTSIGLGLVLLVASIFKSLKA